jgi:uncharacterized membrane protein (GlpM family)
MDYIVKLAITISIIIICTQIGKNSPTLAGLIATMPLTGLIVLIWIYTDNPQRNDLIIDYTRGVVWGIVPTILFFLTALICLKKDLSFSMALCISSSVWLIGAFIHQWFIR